LLFITSNPPSLRVFNSIGEEVAELVNSELIADYYTLNFDVGNPTSSIYFYRIVSENFVQTNMMILIKLRVKLVSTKMELKMKKIGVALLFLCLVSGTGYAQTIGVFGGYGSSQFSEDDFWEGFEQSSFVPVGANLMFNTSSGLSPIQIGGEINYGVVPFTFEMSDGDMHVADLKLNQLYFGAIVKFTIMTGNKAAPYLRGGAGMYTGNAEMEYTSEAKELFESYGITVEDEDIDVSSAFGFNIGAGLNFEINNKNALFFEFVYNIVEREVDEDGGEKFTANSWVVQAGFSFGL